MTPELEVIGGRDVQLRWVIASCYARLDMVDEAVVWLKRAMNRGFIHDPFLAEYEPSLARKAFDP